MNCGNELISVIIPSYNRAGVIKDCLESVLGQTWRNIEVIVVDDGSSDGTEELIRGIGDQRLRYYGYTPNRGACYARNYGAERSQGEYIAFQDSDDLWQPDKLERQLRFMRETGADLVFCGMDRVSPRGVRYYYPVHPYRGRDPVTELLMENKIGTQTMFMRRGVWEETRFDESFKRYQDWDFALRAARRFSIAYEPVSLAYSPVTAGSISASVNSLPALEHLYEKHRDEFDSRPPCLAALERRTAKRLEAADPAAAAGHWLKSFTLRRWPYDLGKYLICRARGLSPKYKKECGVGT